MPGARPAFSSLTYLLVDVKEGTDIRGHFEKANAFFDTFIGAKGRSVLVHSGGGHSQSATLVAAWLMWRKGQSLNSTLAQLRRQLPAGGPSLGFLKQLRAYERELTARRSVDQD